MNEQEIVEWILRGIDDKTFNKMVTAFKGKVGGVPHKSNSRIKRAIIDRMLLSVNYQRTKTILKKMASDVPKENMSTELSKYSNDKIFSQIIRLVFESDLNLATSYIKEINSRKESIQKEVVISPQKIENINKNKKERNVESSPKLTNIDTSLLERNKRLEKKIKFLMSKINELNSTVDQYASTVDRFKKDKEKKEAKIKSLKMSLEMREKENSKYIKKKKSEIEVITQKNNELKDKIDGLMADRTEIERKIQNRDLVIEDLNTQLKDRELLIENLSVPHKKEKSDHIEERMEHNLQIGIPEDLDVEEFRKAHSDTDIIVPQVFFNSSEKMKYYANISGISNSLGKPLEYYDNVFLYEETVPYGDQCFLKNRVKGLKTISRDELIRGEMK
ncbi:hypothetical protein [Levilactobacillus enshiensis]|uniref:hypothetical protein n=1 Tax=Levilactobacillus enshiensis TaxID=2590213 RepID=UPI00117B5008|nr:hypothetical protein [Levilactobacillus enshiensis]